MGKFTGATMTFLGSLRDPVVFAVPAFALFMALEFASLRHIDDDGEYVGYESRDTRTNMIMGVGSLIVNGAARIGALIGYAALYELTPLRWDPHRWYTWVFALLIVDLPAGTATTAPRTGFG